MDSLAKSGWHVMPGGVDGFPTEGAVTAKEVLADALNRDIKDYGGAFVQELVTSAVDDDGVIDTGDSGHVLQVTKIRNVSAPKSNEGSQAAPRMLKITLSDGHTCCHAVEVAKLEKISLTTPPGTKVRLRPGQKIPVKSGFLQLGPREAIQ